MPSRPTSRRGGYRENSGRRKALFHEDPDRFFVALWRELIRYLGHEKAARLAAHFLAAEPIDMADVEGGALRIMSTKIAHHTDDLDNYLFSLVRKARTAPNDDAWLAAFAGGLQADVEQYECPLLGGDTDRTPGPVTVSIATFGSVPHGSMVRRSGARVGDRVVVTGTIGDGTLGLQLRKARATAARWGRPRLARERKSTISCRLRTTWSLAITACSCRR